MHKISATSIDAVGAISDAADLVIYGSTHVSMSVCIHITKHCHQMKL